MVEPVPAEPAEPAEPSEPASGPTPAAAPREPVPDAPGDPRNRGWLIALVVLGIALVISVIVLVSVARPPTYEPVPIPSVSST